MLILTGLLLFQDVHPESYFYNLSTYLQYERRWRTRFVNNSLSSITQEKPSIFHTTRISISPVNVEITCIFSQLSCPWQLRCIRKVFFCMHSKQCCSKIVSLSLKKYNKRSIYQVMERGEYYRGIICTKQNSWTSYIAIITDFRYGSCCSYSII